MKLTRKQASAHERATALLDQPSLSLEERFFVLEHWNPGAEHVNSVASAYFTPVGLARDLSIEVSGKTIIDLYAGIGTLAFFATLGAETSRKVLCVEQRPEYVAVGRKILPHATWVCCDIFNLLDIGRFDCAIANPPFGAARRRQSGPRYHGSRFEYHAIDVASDLADAGVFIIPQESAPFKYSGERQFSLTAPDRMPHYGDFYAATAVELEHSCGIDTSIYRNDWRDVSPSTEIVVCDFKEARARRGLSRSGDLFPQLRQSRA
jgi:hypothetical protein